MLASTSSADRSVGGPEVNGGTVRIPRSTESQVTTLVPAAGNADPADKPPSRAVSVAHSLSAGATGFARGLNDVPKLAAVGAFALVPAGMSLTTVCVIVSLAMLGGSILGGGLMARLGRDVVSMTNGEGLRANLSTSFLVATGAFAGWPMTTTQVSTGAIAGAAGANLRRLNRKTLTEFAFAWLCTPIVAGVVAAVVYLIVR
jgi:PiT family inorganic phosphate transporter